MISFPERICADQDKLPHAVRKQARAKNEMKEGERYRSVQESRQLTMTSTGFCSNMSQMSRLSTSSSVTGFLHDC
jgi:hypothetical protein